MTRAPRTRPLVVRDVASAREVVRARGGRLSRPRQQVLEALFAVEGPVSADYLARARDLDTSSVYRALEHLEALGIARHVHLGHGPGLYGLAGETEREYLACEHCDRVRSVPADRLDGVREAIRAEFGWDARFSHFPIVGLCDTCAARADPEERPRGGAMHDHHDEHAHDHPHAHQHTHDGETHSHAHTVHDHDHVEHEHEHSHGDHVHSHPHVHEPGLEGEHEHSH